MGLQYEKYRFVRTRIDDVEFNKRWRSIDLRLHSLEEGQASIDAAVDSIVAKGLADIKGQVEASVIQLQADVAAAEATLNTLDQSYSDMEANFNALLNQSSFPADSVNVTPIVGLAATDAQTAFAEHQADINQLIADLDALEALHAADFGALAGTVKVAANNTARDALTGLSIGDVVHVMDSDGSGNFQRWQITAVTDGAWSTSTKEEIQLEGAVAAHTHAQTDIIGLVTALSGKAETGHTHAISSVTNLQSSLDAKVPTSRTISAGGIATGGGDMSANRTITVTKAAGSDLRTGTDDTKALTSKAAYDAAAIVSLTFASTISSNFASGSNFTVTMLGNATMGAPSNAKPGQSGMIRIVQDGSGSRLMSDWNAVWKFQDGEHPTLSTAANSVDVLFYVVYDSTTIFANLLKDVK